MSQATEDRIDGAAPADYWEHLATADYRGISLSMLPRERLDAEAKLQLALTRLCTIRGEGMSEFRAPDSIAFRRALERLGEALPRGYADLLRSHYAAPGHTITATRLAHAVGYKNHSAANLHYGTLAARLKSELRWSTGKSVALKLLVEFIDPANGLTPRSFG